jgi:hypothetical protein
MNAGILMAWLAGVRWHEWKHEEMFRQYIEGTSVGSGRNVLRMGLLFLVSGIGMSLHFSANASVTGRVAVKVHGHHGNGRHNKNIFSVHSPSTTHGIQHINNSNIGGYYNSQAALCKKRPRGCRISQKIVALDR